MLQRKAISNDEISEVPPIVHEVLRSPGQPLDPAIRGFFEPRFGHDFSQVRVHRDEQSAHAAEAINASAFTLGNSIWFGRGMYRPEAAFGQRLLAHELAHVVQQGINDPVPSSLHIGPMDDTWERKAENSASRVCSNDTVVLGVGLHLPAATTPGIIRRIPGENARESWDSMVASNFPEIREPRRRAEEAIRRMLATPSGAQLVNNLWMRFCGRRSRCGTRVTVFFVDRLPPQRSGDDTSGFFDPSIPDQPQYQVWVRNQIPSPTGDRVISLGGEWPGGTSFDIRFTHDDPESSMANTLYHELLHVWFIHAQRDAVFPTGHGNVLREEIEPVFLRRIRTFIGELDALESRIRHEATVRERTRPGSVLTPAETQIIEAERHPPSEPMLLGGEVSVHGGAGILRGAARGTGILGADLVLNQIYSLRLGMRGVYLTPDHLLAGGTIGLRILEGENERISLRDVENPLFFDLEGGVLAEITPTDRDRISRNISVLGSAGIGQEFGRQGPRFFWKVGGFVIISDEGQVGGGGTAGAGVRF